MPKGAGYVDAESLKRTTQALQDVKQRSYEALHLVPGSHVLDVGCGPAIDTIPLGRLVGPTGMVIGVDFNRPMTASS